MAKQSGLLDSKGNLIKDDKVDLSQGKIIDLQQQKPNVFIEVTTSNKELLENIGGDKMSQLFVPLAQVMTQFSEATGNKEMIVAFKNIGSKLDTNRTLGIRFVHGDQVEGLLGDEFIAEFFPKEEKSKEDD